jgi:hypothetical protein
MNKTISNAAANLTTAKVKAPTKAERERNLLNRAIASSNKKLESMTLEEARDSFAKGAIREDGLCNVYAMAMNNRFAFTLKDNGHHWSAIWNSKNAKAEGSNLLPVWKAIDVEHKDLLALLEGKHSNAPQVWKRVREKSYQLAFPGQKRPPRQTVAPSESALKKLISAYTTVAREEIQTDRDRAMVMAIGEALIALKVDLSKINQRLANA